MEYARFRPRKPHRLSKGVDETPEPRTGRCLCEALHCGLHLGAAGGLCQAAGWGRPGGALSVVVDRGRLFVTTASPPHQGTVCRRGWGGSHPCVGGRGAGAGGVSDGDWDGGGSGVWAGVWLGDELGDGPGVWAGVGTVFRAGADDGGIAGRRPGTTAGVFTPCAVAAMALNTNTPHTPNC